MVVYTPIYIFLYYNSGATRAYAKGGEEGGHGRASGVCSTIFLIFDKYLARSREDIIVKNSIG
jgi:hypothetical protein